LRKRQHWKWGEGKGNLVEVSSRSTGSSDPLIKGAEVWTWPSGVRVQSITGEQSRRSFIDWVDRQETERSFGFRKLNCGTAKEFTQKLFFSGDNWSKERWKPKWNGKDTLSRKISGISNGRQESFTIKSKTGMLRAENHWKMKISRSQ
jgi:hypothetical protein